MTVDRISSTGWGSTRGRKALIFHSLNQPREHAFDFTDAGVESLLLFLREEPQVARKQKKVFKFACRPKRCVEKLPKLRSTCSAATLGDVCGYRRRSTPHLVRQAVSLRFREGSRRRVDPQDKRMAALPYFQLSVILHVSDNQLSIFPSYLQQKIAGPSKERVSAQLLRVGLGQTKMSICHRQLSSDNRQPPPALSADGVLLDANSQPDTLANPNSLNSLFSYGQLKTNNCRPVRGASC